MNANRRLAVILALWLCVIGHSGASAQTIPLRYGQAYSALRSIFSLPVAVAEREGFFLRQGLNFRVVVPIPGGSDKMIDALHDDTCDVTHVATPFLVRAALAGSDAVAVAAEFNNPIYSLVARPEIKTYGDLKDKLLGLADEAGTITISTRKLLSLHGLRDGDFRVKTIEGTPARLSCLRRGECVAVPLGQPQDLLALMRAIVCSDYRLKRCRNFSIPLRQHGDLRQKQIETPSCAMSALSPPRLSSFATLQTAKRW